MEIIVNDQKATIEEQSSLLSLVERTVGSQQKGIAVAVNSLLVSKKEWGQYTLQSNDQILIIKAAQGG